MTKESQSVVTDPDEGSELRDYAAELFAQRTRNGVRGVLAERVAMDCFRDARAFLAVAAKVESNQLDTSPPKPALFCDACAPNLRKTHPHNLVSQQVGDINRVREIFDQLEKNPLLEAIPELDWKKPEVNLARTLFPHYLARAKELAAAN